VTTDILAFPYLEFPKPGILPQLPLQPHEYTLGDIILGTQKITEDCESDGVELDNYLPVIIAHGLCHLLGYTHDTQENLDKMRNKEIQVLTEFNKRTGYNAVPITPEKLELYRTPKPPKVKKESVPPVESLFNVELADEDK